MCEQALQGGMDPDRGVVRVGDTVRRPAMRSAVGEFLQHLEAVGFDGAPRYLGTDAQQRHVVTWIDGEVPLPPYPAWAMTEEALTSFGRLLRRFHEAAAGFAPSGIDWSRQWSDPRGGAVVCHNDVYPENVVFRNGLAVALIDFDEAAPGRPLWDLAIAAEVWAPLQAPSSRSASAARLDAVHRVGLLAAAYGLDPSRAGELLELVVEERAHALANMRAQAGTGDPVWSSELADPAFEARTAADERWFAEQRPALLARLRRAGGGEKEETSATRHRR